MPYLLRIGFVYFCLISVIIAENSASEVPGQPVLTPQQKLAEEISTLRMAQAIADAARTQSPTAAEKEPFHTLYRDLIARYPEAADPRVVYGEYLRAVGENENAFLQWEAALKLEPQRDDILALQADLLLQTGQIVAAADALERALSINPKNAAHPYGLAHIYTMFRRDLIASRHLTENELITRGSGYFKLAADLAPENPRYLLAYAESFYTQPDADWQLARAAWEKLLAVSENKVFIHSHLVRVNIRLEDKASAEKHLTFLDIPTYDHMKRVLQKQIDQIGKVDLPRP